MNERRMTLETQPKWKRGLVSLVLIKASYFPVQETPLSDDRNGFG